MIHTEKSLNQLLNEAGIETLYLGKPKTNCGTHLSFNGKTIERPSYKSCYKVVLEEFGIDLTIFND
ncbi:MAG: hypothetical protein J7577_00825 [Sphingobacteriaceae bacterium]|nr:hypothetical protein [Sphingobacteriaceae bacterium]